MLEKLTRESFEPLIGQNFKVSNGGQTYDFKLVEVESFPVSGGRRRRGPVPARDPFSLFFVAEPLLQQAMYPMEHEAFGSALEIFIVPVGKAEGGYEYEAVFS